MKALLQICLQGWGHHCFVCRGLPLLHWKVSLLVQFLQLGWSETVLTNRMVLALLVLSLTFRSSNNFCFLPIGSAKRKTHKSTTLEKCSALVKFWRFRGYKAKRNSLSPGWLSAAPSQLSGSSNWAVLYHQQSHAVVFLNKIPLWV